MRAITMAVMGDSGRETEKGGGGQCVAFVSAQRAMKTFVSCGSAAFRLDAHTRYRPSGLNCGKPSNPGSVVICSSPEPSTFTMYRSKLRSEERRVGKECR